MFIGFSVSNFLSFKNPQTMSMMASKVARHKEHILNGNGKKILKTGLIYGANAGGKSNFIKAIDFSRDIILDGLEEVDLNRKYFRISKDGYRQPGVFEYRLITQSKKEYSYGIAISYATKEIISEWLVRIEKSGSETCIFNRDIDENGMNFTFSEVKHKNEAEKIKWEIFLDVFGKNISPAMKKKSILSDVAERSNEKNGILKEIRDVYEWFQSIIILFPTSQYSGLNQLVEKEEVRKYADYVAMEEIITKSDIITFHVPALEDTYHLVCQETIEKMKDGVIIINTARGSIIDTSDLISALESGKIAACALDVIENELGLYYNDYKYKVIGNHELSILRDMPNVLLTPHMAFYTEQAVSDMVEHSIESIVADRDGKENKFRVC